MSKPSCTIGELPVDPRAWIYVEDFPRGLIGPFENLDAARKHLMQYRFGSSYYEIIGHVVARNLFGNWDEESFGWLPSICTSPLDFIIKPEEDVQAYKEYKHESVRS